MAQGKPHVKARRLRDGSGAAAADDNRSSSGRVKLLKEYAMDDFKRIHRAVAAAHRLKHRGIVPVECAFVSEGAVIVQSPFYLGGDMRQWAHGKDPCDVLLALWRVAEALEYLHACNILHRDIKPGKRSTV
jgi:serine/threonine protein kinase